MNLLREYVRIDGRGYVAHAHRSCAEWVHDVLLSETLYAWAARQPDRKVHRGRLPAYEIALPGSGISVVVRHSHHGGLLAPLLRDLFLPPTRASLELARSYLLVMDGVRTPLVLATAVYKAAWILRRSDVVTAAIPGRTLGALIRENEPSERWIAPVAELLTQLASRGLWHPDLNVNNVLLAGEDGATVAYILDIDRLKHASMDPRSVHAANVRRLARSVRKWCTLHRAALDPDWIVLLREAVGKRLVPR